MSVQSRNRVHLCSFTFADGRRCRTPRSSSHLYLCTFHARKETQLQAADSLAHDVSYFFSGDYLSANDLNTALGRLFVAVVQGTVKPKAATILAYLAQTMARTIQLAQHEYIQACGNSDWRKAILNSVNQNFDYSRSDSDTAPEEPQPPSAPPQQPTSNSAPTPTPSVRPAPAPTAAQPPAPSATLTPPKPAKPANPTDRPQTSNPIRLPRHSFTPSIEGSLPPRLPRVPRGHYLLQNEHL